MRGNARYEAVLEYWFGEPAETKKYFEKRRHLWFGGGARIDNAIRRKFERDVKRAARGALKSWEKSPESCLALIVLLDQFSLNLYREQPKSYRQSEMAVPIALRAIRKRWDRKVPMPYRVFFYMPLMHAENLGLQNRCVREFTRLARTAPKVLRKPLGGFVHYAKIHRDVVKKYGRFPGRNETFGRASTRLELKYLENGGYF